MKIGPGRVVGVCQIDDLGVRVDLGGQRRQVVVPVVVGHGAVLDAARFRQHLESDERRFGGEHLVLVAQKGADDTAHDAFAAAAGDHVVHFDVVLRCQHLAQIQAAVGIEVERAERVRHGLDGLGRRAQRILVGGELGDVAKPYCLRTLSIVRPAS